MQNKQTAETRAENNIPERTLCCPLCSEVVYDHEVNATKTVELLDEDGELCTLRNCHYDCVDLWHTWFERLHGKAFTVEWVGEGAPVTLFDFAVAINTTFCPTCRLEQYTSDGCPCEECHGDPGYTDHFTPTRGHWTKENHCNSCWYR